MKAFTLAEMLLIMVLLSVAAAFSLPNLSNSFKQVQLQSSVNNLSLTMRYAQSLAITHNNTIRLVFDKTFKSYQLQEQSKEATDHPFKTISGRWGKQTQLSNEISILSENQSIDFLPNGDIQKNEIEICMKNNCMLISTHDQRGQIEVFDAS